MAVTIVTKNSTAASTAPSAGQLVQGELAVNVTDRKLYTLDGGGNVVQIANGGSPYTTPVSITVNSASDALRITQTGAGNALLVEDSANPDSTPFVIDQNGTVVTGYTLPYATVATNTAITPKFQVQGTTLSTAGVGQYAWSSTTPYYTFNSSTGTFGTYTAITTNDNLGVMQFNGADGTSFVGSSQIRGTVDAAVSTGIVPGRLTFYTASSAGTLTERLRVNSAGAVGIAGANFGTAGQAFITQGTAAAPSWVTQYLSITFIIDGGGATIATGVKGDLTVPFACTITEWTLLADQSGSAVVDIWKDTYANYPPTVADTITASAKPTISATTKGQSSTLTGWTATIAAGDTLRFNVDSCSTITRITLSLKVYRT